ncbi:MAG: NTP transferase domain-containing protein [Phycisphaerales bacterium]|nr:NTP transferase domain-containing protein [Phycisphaerales bacterium]
MNPTLVVLAAGMGSRYGGIKQLEAVGPCGETLMDYSVFDALRAGFDRVVFTIRRDIEKAFREQIGHRYESRVSVDYTYQELADLPDGFPVPEGRTKPWGTGHAVLAAASRVHEPFAVINADDFYGASAFASLSTFLRGANSDLACALVGYTLRGTLSEHGTVSRGLCSVDAQGLLESIVELSKVERRGRGACYPHQDGRVVDLAGDEIVSMNLWGFMPRMFDLIRERFIDFLTRSAGSLSAEFYIPSAVNELMDAGRVRVRVLSGGNQWCGVTYREDLAAAQTTLAGLVKEGAYPAPLWS